MSQAQLMDGAGLARRIVEETAKRAVGPQGPYGHGALSGDGTGR